MVEEYGAEDYGEDVFGGLLERRIENTTGDLPSKFPDIFELDNFDRVITEYVDAHEEQMGGFDGANSYVILSHYVQTADGGDLSRVGRLFGQLGERGQRSIEEYRVYLSNLINSFNARGTLSGVRFAVAAAATTDPDNIIIDEDFEANEYELSIVNTDTAFLSGAIDDLAELADPSAVKLAAAPIIVTTGDSLVLTSDESTVIETTAGLSSGTLTLDGASTLQ